jgi:hypothetical protein
MPHIYIASSVFKENMTNSLVTFSDVLQYVVLGESGKGVRKERVYNIIRH